VEDDKEGNSKEEEGERDMVRRTEEEERGKEREDWGSVEGRTCTEE